MCLIQPQSDFNKARHQLLCSLRARWFRGVQTPDSHLNSITDLINYLRGEEDAEKRRQCAIYGPYGSFVLMQTSFRS